MAIHPAAKNDILREIVRRFDDRFKAEIESSFSTESRRFPNADAGEFTVDGKPYVWIVSEDEAERIARELFEENVRRDPTDEVDESFLRDYVFVREVDKSVVASEEAESLVEGMDEEDILREAGTQSKEDWLDETIDHMSYEEMVDVVRHDSGDDDFLKDVDETPDSRQTAIDEARYHMGKRYDIHEYPDVLDRARDMVVAQHTSEIYEQLSNPVSYFVDDHGMYSFEELLSQPFISIDIDRLVEDSTSLVDWNSLLNVDAYETTDGGVIIFPESW